MCQWNCISRWVRAKVGGSDLRIKINSQEGDQKYDHFLHQIQEIKCKNRIESLLTDVFSLTNIHHSCYGYHINADDWYCFAFSICGHSWVIYNIAHYCCLCSHSTRTHSLLYYLFYRLLLCLLFGLKYFCDQSNRCCWKISYNSRYSKYIGYLLYLPDEYRSQVEDLCASLLIKTHFPWRMSQAMDSDKNDVSFVSSWDSYSDGSIATNLTIE